MDIKIYLFMYFFAVGNTDIRCKSLHVDVQSDDDGKIVGGEETAIEIYPYQAHLLLNDGRYNYQCGGSIISENFIITAAHCLTGIKYILVRIGSSDRGSGGVQYNTTKFNMHPSYDSATKEYDIGLVTIREGMDFKVSRARPIAVANVFNDPDEDEVMIITGWGLTTEAGSTSNTLMAAEVPVVDRDDCNKQLGGGVTTSMFCAGYEEGGVDACQGDSGGPAVSRRTGRLVGITSYGYGCARPNLPGVYTRIGHLAVKLYITFMTGLYNFL